ncbi:ABC transporter permease subunit [Pseudalkalibacillus salsuginis]|uniref:ABC transporter permease subunit n=1 Tax=Pseudalkalibacillus salsuginis TaxID=2910972 RepID=UPI001F1FE364|nr:ABC transporter permease subunit [Pseudalkalibacillus salsuginis]MCF6410350.1 ABC transporter permease subunit [Pseudalkalibacillus salsuginis]
MSLGGYFKRLKSIMIGIIFIGFLPSLLYGFDQTINFQSYIFNRKTYDLFPGIFDKYVYSMTIFFGALLLGLFLAILFTFCTTLLPRLFKMMVYGMLTLFESIPDLFIVISLQLLIVYIYQKTGWLISNVTVVYDDKIYLLPILVLSVLPTVQLFRISFLLLEEERDKPYVTVAKSMGLGDYYILFQHVFRNVLFNLFLYFKTIFVFMLSNLFIMEYVFNIHGLMRIMLSPNIFVFIVGTIMITIPFLFLFELAQSRIDKSTGEKKEETA